MFGVKHNLAKIMQQAGKISIVREFIIQAIGNVLRKHSAVKRIQPGITDKFLLRWNQARKQLLDRQGQHHGLEFQRHLPFQQERYSLLASLVRHGRPGNRFVSITGISVQRDLNGKRRPFCQTIFEVRNAPGE